MVRINFNEWEKAYHGQIDLDRGEVDYHGIQLYDDLCTRYGTKHRFESPFYYVSHDTFIELEIVAPDWEDEVLSFDGYIFCQTYLFYCLFQIIKHVRNEALLFHYGDSLTRVYVADKEVHNALQQQAPPLAFVPPSTQYNNVYTIEFAHTTVDSQLIPLLQGLSAAISQMSHSKDTGGCVVC
eukprot:jgi/Psemu1/1492/gm1.1492_g